MFLIENKAEIAYTGLLHQVAGLCTKAQNAHYIRALKQFISSIDDDYKNLRFVGEDVMTDQEAVTLVQHGWDPTYVASVYLEGVVNDGEECFEKIRELFVKQKTWYSGATFESIQNFYDGTSSEGGLSISSIIASNRCKKVLERDTEMESMMEKGNVYIDLTDKHVDLLEMFDPDYNPISNMSTILENVFKAKGGITVVQPDHLKYHVKSKHNDIKLTWGFILQEPYYEYEKLEFDFPQDFTVLLSSVVTHTWELLFVSSFPNLRGETLVRWLVPAIAKSMYQIAVSTEQVHRLHNLQGEMKAGPSIQTEISLIHGHPVDLSDVKLARSSRNLSHPVLENHRVVQTGITIDKGLIPEIILSRLENKTLTMKQKFAVTGYRDVVLVSTSRASGGLVIPRAGFFNLFRNHLESQTLSHTVMPGDIIDAYHLAAVICRGHLGHRKLMERAKYDLGVARLYFKADIEFYARSGRQDVLSKLIPKGYEPRPAAMREVICEMYRAGVDIWGSPSKCWVTLQLETLLKSERCEIIGKRSELNANHVIMLDGVECYNQHVRGNYRFYKITTDQNHVHHLVSCPTQGIRSGKTTVLHGAVAGQKPW